MAFDAFHAVFSPTRYRELTDEATTRLGARVPADLIDLLRTDGFAFYGPRLFWTVDDADVEAARQAWLPAFPQVSVLACGAFGQLFLWDGATVQVLLPHTAQVGLVAYTVTQLCNEGLTPAWYIEDGLQPASAAAAERAVGPLAPDEMYGYEPALALGGSGDLDTLRRYKLVEHHILLSQLQELRPLGPGV